MEVDAVQHEKNLAADRPGNVEFAAGGADAIPLPDASVDVVLMLKSLHHVPVARMDAALAEIARVLAPGGFAYFSEPIYAGEFNAIVALFHDERVVREAAFAALVRAVGSGRFELAAERFWRAKRRFAGFAEFDERLIRATHTEHRLSDDNVREGARALPASPRRRRHGDVRPADARRRAAPARLIDRLLHSGLRVPPRRACLPVSAAPLARDAFGPGFARLAQSARAAACADAQAHWKL